MGHRVKALYPLPLPLTKKIVCSDFPEITGTERVQSELLCCVYPCTCELCMRAWEQDYFGMSRLLTFSEVANIILHYRVFHGLGLFENTLKQQ